MAPRQYYRHRLEKYLFYIQQQVVAWCEFFFPEAGFYSDLVIPQCDATDQGTETEVDHEGVGFCFTRAGTVTPVSAKTPIGAFTRTIPVHPSSFPLISMPDKLLQSVCKAENGRLYVHAITHGISRGFTLVALY